MLFHPYVKTLGCGLRPSSERKEEKKQKHTISSYTTKEKAAGKVRNISATKQTTTLNQSGTKPYKNNTS